MAKITLFLPSLDGGGAERVNINLAKGFADAGHEVDLVCISAKGEYEKDVPDSVRLIDFSTNSNLVALRKFMKYLQISKPDVVLATLIPSHVAALIAKILTQSSAKIICRTDCNISSLAHELSLIRQLRIKGLYPFAHSHICVSEGVRKDLLERFRIKSQKVCTIYNPFEIEVIEQLSKEKADHPWLQNRTIPTLVSVGRLVAAKDHVTMLKALYEANKHVDVRLIILGQGILESQLKKLANDLGIADKVDFVGFQHNPYSYIAHSNGLILTSKIEGFGNVLVEALVCGVAIISTDCPSGPSEVIEEGKYGRLLKVGDVKAISKAIEHVIETPVDSSLQRRRAQDFALKKITQEYLTKMHIT